MTDLAANVCEECGFSLWLPISSLSNSHVGLYSDARFPGRCIVSMREHFDHLDEVTPDSLFGFLMDVRNCVAAIKMATGVDRVNVAVLGNQETHVHAHLIPRLPSNEPNPSKAPWEDTRTKRPLDKAEEESLIDSIRSGLVGILRGSKKYPIVRPSRGPQLPTPQPEPATQLFAMLSDEGISHLGPQSGQRVRR